jgi:hypothetical protein
MCEIVGFKKKINYIYFVNDKNINNHLIKNFNIISEKKLTSSTDKVESKIV